MLLVFPTSTDSQTFHFPFATIGLVFACIVIFVLQCINPDAAEHFILRHQVFNPLTWFSSCLMHGNISHLVGNMIVLAICGWIVEGKVGWWKFLAIFFAIGVSANIFEQLLFFAFSQGGSLGASGAIYGLMAVAFIWAPESEVTFMAVGLLFYRPIATTFSASVSNICFVLIMIEFLIVWFSFFALSSALLHLMGVIPGAIIGYVMVKRRLVDCEGYDLMSIRSGRAGQRVKTVAQERLEEEQKKEAIQAAKQKRVENLESVNQYIDDGHYEMAFRKFSMIKRKGKPLVMPEDQYVAIINGLWANERTKSRAIPIMKSYLEHHDKLKTPIVLKLARHALADERNPHQSIEWLRQLDPNGLNEKQKQIWTSILKSAKQAAAM